MSNAAHEIVRPVRFVETRNRTPKSLGNAEALGGLLHTIGETIGTPDVFAPIGQFLDAIAANPQLTTVDCWYTPEEISDRSSRRGAGLGLRPVLLLPFTTEATGQPAQALCVQFEDTFSQFGLDTLAKTDNSIVDALTTAVVTTVRQGSPVMELSLVTAQRIQGASAENSSMRILEDASTPKLVLMYNNSAGTESGNFAFIVVERDGQQIPLQLSVEDSTLVRDLGQYFRRVLDRDSSRRIWKADRAPRLTGTDEENTQN
jgi:hypothetical protein